MFPPLSHGGVLLGRKSLDDVLGFQEPWDNRAVRVCACVGPQNGDPVCPCKMADHLQRQLEREAYELIFARDLRRKPRIRVKAISTPAPTSHEEKDR